MTFSCKIVALYTALCITCSAMASETSRSTNYRSSTSSTRAPVGHTLSTLLQKLESTSTALVTVQKETDGLSYFCQLDLYHSVSSIKSTKPVCEKNKVRTVTEYTALETSFNPACQISKNTVYRDLHALVIHQQLALIAANNSKKELASDAQKLDVPTGNH